MQLTLPTTWNELSQKQLQNIAFQLECYHFGIRDNADADVELRTRLYIAISKELLRGNKYQAVRKALQEIAPGTYAPYVKFIFEANNRTQFLEKVKINNTTYYGPALRLRNVTIGEFSIADAFYYNWRTTHKVVYLNALCATLYRQAAAEPTEIDIRKPFQKLTIDERLKKFDALNYQTKLSIAYTYEGSRNHLVKTYTHVFPKAPENSTLKPKYIPFGEVILDKINGDPSKLITTQALLTSDFLAVYNKDIRDINTKQK